MSQPFQAATTLSSRPGCGRFAREASSVSRSCAHRFGSPGSAGSCSVDAPSSNVPADVTRQSPATHAPSATPSTSVSSAGVHT